MTFRHIRIRRAFTLLEIVVVMAILSMIACVTGWQITKAVSSYAFQHEVEDLYRDMKAAQILALTYQTDIHLHLFQDQGVLYYRFSTLEPFPEFILSRARKELKETKKLLFNRKEIKHLNLSLFSQGNIEPRGIVGLFSTEDAQELWIDFQGAFLLALSVQEPRLIRETLPIFPEENHKNVYRK